MIGQSTKYGDLFDAIPSHLHAQDIAGDQVDLPMRMQFVCNGLSCQCSSSLHKEFVDARICDQEFTPEAEGKIMLGFRSDPSALQLRSIRRQSLPYDSAKVLIGVADHKITTDSKTRSRESGRWPDHSISTLRNLLQSSSASSRNSSFFKVPSCCTTFPTHGANTPRGSKENILPHAYSHSPSSSARSSSRVSYSSRARPALATTNRTVPISRRCEGCRSLIHGIMISWASSRSSSMVQWGPLLAETW